MKFMKQNPIAFFLCIFALGTVSGAAMLHWKWKTSWPIGFLFFANLMAFLIWYYDKLQAKRGGWRVPEKAMHWMAFLGAAIGSLGAMQMFRHKTLKTHFKVIYGLLLILQCYLFFAYMRFLP